MQMLLLVAVLNQAASVPPVRDPSFATDGRLAVAFEGDLWIRDAGGRRWTRLTSGPAWDRQPAWSPDGRAIVFVSPRRAGEQGTAQLVWADHWLNDVSARLAR